MNVPGYSSEERKCRSKPVSILHLFFRLLYLKYCIILGVFTIFFFNLPKREITIQKYILIPQFYILQLSSDLHKKRIDYVSSEYLYLCLTWILLFGTSSFYTSGFFQIRSLMGSQHSETNMSNPKEIIRQGLGNPVGVNHHVRPSLSSEQLVSQSTSPQMLQQMTRF